MKLTRRQMFAGLLAPFAAPKLLEAAKTFTIASKAAINPPNRYNSDTFYRFGVDFTRPVLTRLESHALEQVMLNTASVALRRAVMAAAAGRKIIWCAPMELHAFVDTESVGPIGAIPRCRHIAAYDLTEDRWVHRVDVEVAFTEPGQQGTRYFEYATGTHKIGDTVHVRRPIRWLANQPGIQSSL